MVSGLDSKAIACIVIEVFNLVAFIWAIILHVRAQRARAVQMIQTSWGTVHSTSERLGTIKLLAVVCALVSCIAGCATYLPGTTACTEMWRIAALLYVLDKALIYFYLFTKNRLVRPMSTLNLLEKLVALTIAAVVPFAIICGVLVKGTRDHGTGQLELCGGVVPPPLSAVMMVADTSLSAGLLWLFIEPLRSRTTRYPAYADLVTRNFIMCVITVTSTSCFMLWLILGEVVDPLREYRVFGTPFGSLDLAICNLVLAGATPRWCCASRADAGSTGSTTGSVVKSGAEAALVSPKTVGRSTNSANQPPPLAGVRSQLHSKAASYQAPAGSTALFVRMPHPSDADAESQPNTGG